MALNRSSRASSLNFKEKRFLMGVYQLIQKMHSFLFHFNFWRKLQNLCFAELTIFDKLFNPLDERQCRIIPETYDLYSTD